MLYIAGLVTTKNKDFTIREYKLVDTLSELYTILTPDKLRYILLHCKMKVANAELQNNNIIIPNWVNKTASRTYNKDMCEFTLLAKDEDRYKIATCYGTISWISLDEIQTLIKEKDIANYEIIDNEEKWHDTYEIIRNKQFEETIAEKYKIFRGKALIMGYGDISFEYGIENQQVKLTRYTGSSRNVILPSFITSIRINAFRETTLNTLNLNEGLQAIGTRAFAPQNWSRGLESVEIPSTVQIIGKEAFNNNKDMYKNNGSLNMDKLKLRNSKTLLLDTFEY